MVVHTAFHDLMAYLIQGTPGIPNLSLVVRTSAQLLLELCPRRCTRILRLQRILTTHEPLLTCVFPSLYYGLHVSWLRIYRRALRPLIVGFPCIVVDTYVT